MTPRIGATCGSRHWTGSIRRERIAMTITYDRLVSLAVFAAVAVVMLAFYPMESAVLSVIVATVICAPGLVLIWFPEPLGEIGCFARGVVHDSPPALIAAIGWVFLVGYPLLLAYVTR
jgi:hypothetical protein